MSVTFGINTAAVMPKTTVRTCERGLLMIKRNEKCLFKPYTLCYCQEMKKFNAVKTLQGQGWMATLSTWLTRDYTSIQNIT